MDLADVLVALYLIAVLIMNKRPVCVLLGVSQIILRLNLFAVSSNK